MLTPELTPDITPGWFIAALQHIFEVLKRQAKKLHLHTCTRISPLRLSSLLTPTLSSELSLVLKLSLVFLFSSQPDSSDTKRHWLTISTILRIPGSVLAYSGLNEILDRVGDGVDWGSYVIVTASDIFATFTPSTHRIHQYPGQTPSCFTWLDYKLISSPTANTKHHIKYTKLNNSVTATAI